MDMLCTCTSHCTVSPDEGYYHRSVIIRGPWLVIVRTALSWPFLMNEHAHWTSESPLQSRFSMEQVITLLHPYIQRTDLAATVDEGNGIECIYSTCSQAWHIFLYLQSNCASGIFLTTQRFKCLFLCCGQTVMVFEWTRETKVNIMLCNDYYNDAVDVEKQGAHCDSYSTRFKYIWPGVGICHNILLCCNCTHCYIIKLSIWRVNKSHWNAHETNSRIYACI